MSIRVCLAEDNDFYFDGLQSILADMEHIVIAGACKNGKEVLSLLETVTIDVLITDIRMPEMDGIQLTQYVTKHYPDIKVIALTMYTEDQLIVEMIEAGAKGYLNKNAQIPHLGAAIQNVFDGNSYCCPTTSKTLMDLIAGSQLKLAKPDVIFNQQEKEIIRMVCEEYVNKQIADKLNLSYNTVETYRLRIQQKMGVKGTVGMVVYAVQNGIV